VTLSDQRAPGGRARWVSAISWSTGPGATPRIVFDAIVLGSQSTDPDEGAALAILTATVAPVDAVLETAPIDTMPWRHGTWCRAHGEATRAHVRGLASMRTVRV
jgi:hypothetical protein